MRFASWLPVALAVCPVLACTDAGIPGSGASEPAYGLHAVACTDTFETVFVDGQGVGGAGGSQIMVVVDDTLFYETDNSTIQAFAPGSPTRTFVLPAALGGIGQLWPDGDSFVLYTSAGVVRLPMDGGQATQLATAADAAPLLSAQPLAFAKDATAIYGAGMPDPSTGVPADDARIARQPVAGGPADVVADVPLTLGGGLGYQLFDQGDSLWLEDAAGEVFSIAKASGGVQKLADNLGTYAVSLFAPDGTSGMFGALANGNTLASFALDGTQTVLWPPSAPTFATTDFALDGDRTAYVVGWAYASATETHAAFATVSPGAAPTGIRCFAEGGSMRLLRPGRSVVYAKLLVAGQWSVVRFQK